MRFASYVRLSKSDDDRAVSLDSQREACRRYVSDQGGTIVLDAQDIQSGLDVDRAGYQSILTAARAGRIDAALVFRFDRWGRDTLEALRSLRELADMGIDVVSVTESSEDPFVRDFLLLLANRESRTISARVAPVLRMKAAAGRWNSRPPAGYDLRDGKLAPNAMAPLVRELFERAQGTESIASLRRWAASVGLRGSSGKTPSRNFIHKLLKNPAYVGDVVYARESNGKFERRHLRPESEWVVAHGAHPALVTRDTFDAVQAVLASHKRFQAGVRGSRWLLTGRVRCGWCGSRMYGRPGHSPTYFCYRGVDFDGCKLRYTGAVTLERYVRDEVLAIVPGLHEGVAEIIKAEAARLSSERSQQRQNLNAAYVRHQEMRDRLAGRRMAEEIPRDVYRRMEEREATAIKAIEAEMGKLEAPAPAVDLEPIMDMLEAVTWDTLDDEAWQEVVCLLVERVEVRGLGDYQLTWSAAGQVLAAALAKSVP